MQSAPTCTSILTFVNVDSGETTVISADVLPSPDDIIFAPAQLDTNSPDPTPTGPMSHHYDNMVLAEGPSPSYDYQLTLCAAYGVH